MTDDDKTLLVDRIKRGVAAASTRGLTVWGYQLRGGRLDLWTRPTERKRRAAAPDPDPAPRSSRGVASQGNLL